MAIQKWSEIRTKTQILDEKMKNEDLPRISTIPKQATVEIFI